MKHAESTAAHGRTLKAGDEVVIQDEDDLLHGQHAKFLRYNNHPEYSWVEVANWPQVKVKTVNLVLREN